MINNRLEVLKRKVMFLKVNEMISVFTGYGDVNIMRFEDNTYSIRKINRITSDFVSVGECLKFLESVI